MSSLSLYCPQLAPLDGHHHSAPLDEHIKMSVVSPFVVSIVLMAIIIALLDMIIVLGSEWTHLYSPCARVAGIPKERAGSVAKRSHTPYHHHHH